VRDGLAVNQSTDDADRLLKAIEALAKARSKVDAKGFVLAFEPAASDPENGPTAGQMVEGRGEFGGMAGVPERVCAHEQAEPDPIDEDGERGQRGPSFELGIGWLAFVGQQVIVDPDRIPAGRLDRPTGRQQVRPARSVDPESRPEAHRHRAIVAS
jgi:hypothetical protein